MPDIFPNHYWFFHSLWHLALAGGYYELYALIEYDSNTVYRRAKRQKYVRAKQQTARAVEQAMGRNSPNQLPAKTKVQVCLEAPCDAKDCTPQLFLGVHLSSAVAEIFLSRAALSCADC